MIIFLQHFRHHFRPFIQLIAGIFRLEFMASYFSDQLVSGFAVGSAVHVYLSQVDDIFGITVPKSSGYCYIFRVSIFELTCDQSSTVVRKMRMEAVQSNQDFFVLSHHYTRTPKLFYCKSYTNNISMFQRIYDIIIRIPQTNFYALGLSIFGFLFLYVGKEYLSLLINLCLPVKVPVPYELILVS